MRFDRRKTYPESNVASKLEVLKTIVPEKVGGVIKSRGAGNVPLNVAVGKIGHPFIWQLEAQRMNEGATSPFFGSERINGFNGVTFPHGTELIAALNFPESGIPAELVYLNATGELTPEGLLVTATAAANFGIFLLYPVPPKARIAAVANKVKGTFVNWEGEFNGNTYSVKPGNAEIDGRQAITSIDVLDNDPTIDFGLRGVTTVSAGDQMLVSWLGIVTQK